MDPMVRKPKGEQPQLSGRDRHAKQRFPIDQPVYYKLLYGENIGHVGEGRTVSMSANEVSFTVVSTLPSGIPVELTVAWPALLHGSVAMKLMLYGIVMHTEQSVATLKITRHEFRTQRLGGFAAPVS
jgi:hypothetical protein